MKDDKHVLEMRPQAASWNVIELNRAEIDAVIESLGAPVAQHFAAGMNPATVAQGLLNVASRILQIVYGHENAVVNLRGFADSLEEDGDPLEMEPPVGNA